MHQAAVNAACPSIRADRSIVVPCYNFAAIEVVLRWFHRVTRLQVCEFGSNGCMAMLVPRLASLHALKHLDLNRNLCGAAALGPHLVKLASLQHLDLN